jgi:arginyl-tRNA--protein-N-Asp/Glu arginylyltransferase
LNTGHSYGKIEDIMEIIKLENKGKHLGTLEKYHIFRSYKQKIHLNDNNIDVYDPIFNAIHKKDDRD